MNKLILIIVILIATILPALSKDFQERDRNIDVNFNVERKVSIAYAATKGPESNIAKARINGLKEIRKADGNYSNLEGTWKFIFGDLLNQDNSDLLTAEYVCLYEEEWDDYYFTPSTNQFLPFLVYYDENTSEINLPFSWIGYNNEHYIFQGGWHIDYSEGKIIFPEDFYFMFDKSTGSIVIEEDCGICWSAYDTGTFEYVGDYEWLKMEEAVITEASDNGNEDLDTGWLDIGDATFMDGWVMPGFDIDQTDPVNQYKVPLQRNATDENLYRLVDPYHRGPVAEFNESKVKGYIQFDVSDPSHVVFHRVNAGFANAEMGIVTFYCYNLLGYFMEYAEWKMSLEEMLKVTGSQIPYTSFHNGMVSLGYVQGAGGPLYDANFGYQGDKVGGYHWQDEVEGTPDMTAAIIFPSDFDAVHVIDDDAESGTLYYDLQGMRISKPDRGKIYIVRKGNSVKKSVIY